MRGLELIRAGAAAYDGFVRRLTQADLDALADALRDAADVLLAYVHGSALDPAADPRDLDLAVVFEGPPGRTVPTARLVELADRLERRLGLAPIDLRPLEEAPLFFQDLVARRGRCVFERSRGLRAAWEGRVLSEFLEFKPALEAYDRAMIRHAREGFHGR